MGDGEIDLEEPEFLALTANAEGQLMHDTKVIFLVTVVLSKFILSTNIWADRN